MLVAPDHSLAMTQEQPDALAVVGLDMGDLEQACAHRLRDQSRVPPVRLDGRSFCEGFHLADLDADDGKPPFGKPAEEPRRQRTGLETDAADPAIDFIDASPYVVWVAGSLATTRSITTFPSSSMMQIAVSFTETSNPT